MGRRPSAPLRPLEAAEQQELARIARASSERADRVQRAQALLAVSEGCTFVQAAAQAGWRCGDSVGALVRRFNRDGLAALRIVACAQREPDREQDGTATWSLSTLERALRQVLPHLGATTIRRVLQDAGRSYQQARTWCPTGTAIRKRKAGPVQVTDPLTEEKRDA